MDKLRKDVKEASAYGHAATVIAALALIVSLLGSWVTFTVSNRSQHTAERSVIAAHQTAEALAAYKALGKQRRQILHDTDVKACVSRHVLVKVFHDYLNDSISAGEKLVGSGAFKTLSPQLQQAQSDGLTRARGFVKSLKMADCTSVPPLTPPKKEG